MYTYMCVICMSKSAFNQRKNSKTSRWVSIKEKLYFYSNNLSKSSFFD